MFKLEQKSSEVQAASQANVTIRVTISDPRRRRSALKFGSGDRSAEKKTGSRLLGGIKYRDITDVPRSLSSRCRTKHISLIAHVTHRSTIFDSKDRDNDDDG